MDMPTGKLCKTCDQIKPSAEFYVHRGHKDGLSHQCKSCDKARQKSHYEANCESIKAQELVRYHANKEARKAKSRSWNTKNREKIRQAKWTRPPNTVCRTCKTPFWAKAAILRRGGGKYCSKECLYARNSKRSEKRCPQCNRRKPITAFYPESSRRDGRTRICKQCMNKAANKWRRTHPDKANEWRLQYQLRKTPSPSNSRIIEVIDRKYIYERDGGRCHVCHRKVSKKAFLHSKRPSIDHLIPLAEPFNGDHTHLNVALAHVSCNARHGKGRFPVQLRLLP